MTANFYDNQPLLHRLIVMLTCGIVRDAYKYFAIPAVFRIHLNLAMQIMSAPDLTG